MQFRKGHSELTVMEAVDNLSHLAELDLSIPQEKLEGVVLTEEQLSDRFHANSWHDPEYNTFNRERIKETFMALLKYMKDLYEKDKGHLREEKTQRGIQAIMLLATEAAQKIDHYSQIFKGEKDVSSASELKEFKELQHYYHTKVVQRFQTLAEPSERWEQEWGSGDIAEIKEAALKDLETVRKDKEYELFLIKKEDGMPYFNRTLLRHMQLVSQFDSILVDKSMEDPFLRIQIILDKDAHSAAKEILQAAAPYVDAYWKEALKFKKIEFVAAINKALMSLMMAANSRNLMQNSIGKYALNYYTDFQYYLRLALASPEYHKFVAAKTDQKERFLHSVMSLSHVLCGAFFLKVGTRKEMSAFIHMLIEKGVKGSTSEPQTSSPLSLWNNLNDQDNSIRYLLRQYPNGPLLKTMRLFTEDNQLKGFDPIRQLTQMGQLFTIAGESMHISCIQLPCPISQQFIAKAEIIEEFEGFLRLLKFQNKNQKHLLINLQDRTSWNEHARCIALEQIQQEMEFENTLMVVTLPKNGDFYMQSGTYVEWDDAKEFMKQLKAEVSSGEICGFFFPETINRSKLLKFVDGAMEAIHTLFFASKERLIHKNRLDFIEIFYLLLTLKLIEEFTPDSMSFTCKDAIDTGSAAAAGMFAFLRIMNDPSSWSKEESDFLLWMLYAASLTGRERAIDVQRLNRTISALAIIHGELEAHRSEIVDVCSKLFQPPFFKGITVKEASSG